MQAAIDHLPRAEIVIKRVYDQALPDDGLRVLTDRLWPRGLSKAAAHVDLWIKEAAPSTELRRWFNHEPAKWEEFVRRYTAEIAARPEALTPLLQAAGQRRLTLLYAARDADHNHTRVLLALLLRQLDAA